MAGLHVQCLWKQVAINLFSGPMWKVVGTGQQGAQSVSGSCRISEVHKVTGVCVLVFTLSYHVQARVNIPAVSARTIQRDISSSSKHGFW